MGGPAMCVVFFFLLYNYASKNKSLYSLNFNSMNFVINKWFSTFKYEVRKIDEG